MAEATAATRVIAKRAEPHRLVDRVQGKLLFLIATPALLAALRRPWGVTELWIGDSHALTFNRKVTNGNFVRGPEGQIILRVGARLMHSLAFEGFPPRAVRAALLIGRFGRPGAIIPIFSAGEIDVRVHLASRLDDPLTWVGNYVTQCMRMAQVMRAPRVGFVVPPPPADVRPEDVWYPVNGTIEERATMHARMRDALTAAVAEVPLGPDVPQAVLIDVTDELAGPSGAMRLDLTADGHHPTAAVIPMVRDQVRRSGLLDG